MNCEKIEFKQSESMAQQTIGIGSAYDDPTADKTRDAFDKVNDNFNEIYTSVMLHDYVIISDWDMDATASKDATWTLPADHLIIRVTAIIRSDAGSTTAYDFASGGQISYDGTKFTLARTGGGVFDSTDFNASTGTRAVIYVDYHYEDLD